MKTLIEKVTNEKSIKYTSFNLKGVHTLENSILGSFGCVHGHSQVGKLVNPANSKWTQILHLKTGIWESQPTSSLSSHFTNRFQENYQKKCCLVLLSL